MAHVHSPGLVLRMDPDELVREGAVSSCAEDDAVHAQHYFLCIEANPRDALWAPLLTGARVGTRELPKAVRSGDPRWLGSTAHYDPGQIWRATHKAAQRAAAAAHDSSSGKLPNRVNIDAVPAVADFAPIVPSA